MSYFPVVLPGQTGFTEENTRRAIARMHVFENMLRLSKNIL